MWVCKVSIAHSVHCTEGVCVARLLWRVKVGRDGVVRGVGAALQSVIGIESGRLQAHSPPVGCAGLARFSPRILMVRERPDVADELPLFSKSAERREVLRAFPNSVEHGSHGHHERQGSALLECLGVEELGEPFFIHSKEYQGRRAHC